MPHKIAMIEGRPAIMFVGETPWHGLGLRLEKSPNTDTAIRAAGLNWNVVKKPVYAFDGGAFCVVPGYQATVREDRWGQHECTPFGLVGENYEVLQNRDAFAFFEPLIQSGSVTYETAGALGDGERVWMLAKVHGDIRIKGEDRIERYLLLSNGHDGRTALQIRFTPVRVVCMNTLIWALASSDNILKAHHGRGMNRRVERAEEAVKLILGRYDELATHFERLAAVSMTTEKLARYVNTVFPTPKRKPNQTDRSYEQNVAENNRLRDTSARLFIEGRGNDQAAIRGTLWAAYNGVTEVLDHYLGYRDRNHRMESLCFGDGERTKRRAFDVALDFARN